MRTWARHSLAFLDSEKSGGIILLTCTLLSIGVSNSLWADGYLQAWDFHVAGKSVEFWINDGLMTFFFLQVGLEIVREIHVGELNDVKKSMLPVLAAFGGMIVPAIIHLSFNFKEVSQNGYGIPMATDIAFSLGLLSLLGKRVPLSLKVFLTALAIIDDLGAIMVIAIFYSSGVLVLYLTLAIGIFVAILIMKCMSIKTLWIYLPVGCAMWFCMERSGIHPTISGVMLAFAIPLGHGDDQSPASQLQHFLHKPVSFIVLPLFALANTAIKLPSAFASGLISPNSVGVISGLVLGKPLGIFLFSWLGLKLGWCVLPHTIKLKHLLYVGMLAGIGFTMSIFITLLAFDNEQLIVNSKIAVLTGSLISGLLGTIILGSTFKKK